ncbi:MAG: hypothetical protein ACK2U1_06610 [Anaerolineales bacterium]|jgi:hypothetical protein
MNTETLKKTENAENIEFLDYENFEDQEEPEMCPEYLGSGFVLICIDDICNGLGYCIHGDGEMICPNCHGEGEI